MVSLISIIDTTYPVLFKHFLNHYSSYGITNFYCCFHSVSKEINPNLEECIDLFQSYSKGKYTLYLGEEFNCLGKHQKVMALRALSDADGHEWKAVVDYDEFYILHGSAEDFLKKIEPYDAVRGIMVDRLARHGFPPLEKNENIFKQFPLNAFVTNNLVQGAASKIFFHRKGFDICGGHHALRNKNVSFYPEWLPCYHFKWDESCIKRMKWRMEHYRKMNLPWWVEAEKFVNNHLSCWDYIADPQVGQISQEFHIGEFSAQKNDIEWFKRKITLNLEKGFD